MKLAERGNRHLIQLESNLRCELNEVLNQIETMWFEKSRIDAIRDGDRNTRYFHLGTIIQRRFNCIKSLMSGNDIWLTNRMKCRGMSSSSSRTFYGRH